MSGPRLKPDGERHPNLPVGEETRGNRKLTGPTQVGSETPKRENHCDDGRWGKKGCQQRHQFLLRLDLGLARYRCSTCHCHSNEPHDASLIYPVDV
jgi:hypothetical protein